TRCRVVEALADFPWKALPEGLFLAVAARQIDPGGIAENSLKRLVGRGLADLPADGDNQLSLELKVVGERRIRYNCAFRNDGVGRLLEEEGRVAFVTFFHLADMRDVVPPDAVNAPYRKLHLGADDSQCRHFQRKHQFHSR